MKLFAPNIFHDSRGWLTDEHILCTDAVPFNIAHRFTSYSKQNVLRGLHFQTNDAAQDKLVICLSGIIMDVIVDVRPESATFRSTFNYLLGPEMANYAIHVPQGFAHGFTVKSEQGAVVQYLVSSRFEPKHYRVINPFDKSLNIDWGGPVSMFTVSEQDKTAPMLHHHINQGKKNVRKT